MSNQDKLERVIRESQLANYAKNKKWEDELIDEMQSCFMGREELEKTIEKNISCVECQGDDDGCFIGGKEELLDSLLGKIPAQEKEKYCNCINPQDPYKENFCRYCRKYMKTEKPAPQPVFTKEQIIKAHDKVIKSRKGLPRLSIVYITDLLQALETKGEK